MTPTSLSLVMSSSTSATLLPASRVGGSSTLSTVRRGATSMPSSWGVSLARGFFLAFCWCSEGGVVKDRFYRYIVYPTTLYILSKASPVFIFHLHSQYTKWNYKWQRLEMFSFSLSPPRGPLPQRTPSPEDPFPRGSLPQRIPSPEDPFPRGSLP